MSGFSRKENTFVKICWYIYSFALSRRYKIVIKGIELLEAPGGKIMFPNHQSHVDPQIMAIQTFKYSGITPVVADRFFKIPVIKFFLRKWEAVKVSDLKSNRDMNILQRMNKEIHEAAKRGKAVIIYPSGQLTDQGIERVYNKQGAYSLMADLPDNVKVLGVRISGLWGSIWSKAWEGKQPPFLPTYIKAIGIWFANLIFFAPKRTVTIEFVDITKEAKEQAKNDRKTFNAFLENFYNVNGMQEPVYIKHFFFAPRSKRKLPENLRKKTE